MQWYYSNDGNQQGPVSEDEIKAKIASGALKSSDLVWKDGMPGWVPLSQVPELRAAQPGAVSSVPSVPSATEGDTTRAEASPYQTPNSPVVPAQNNFSNSADIPSYMWQSIAATILCCLPFGVVAIVYAAKVDGLKQVGDLAGAREASKKAKLWVNLSAGVILVLIVLGMIGNLMEFLNSGR